CHVVHRSSDATARPTSWWSLLPLPHRVQRNTVGTRWSRGRCWKGTNRGRKNLSIRSGRRSFAVRGDGSCKGETRHSGIDMNARRIMYAVTPNPACDGTDHGDPGPAFSQPTRLGRLWISL